MLTAEQNERLTKVGPGTPTGELMRRYWHPIAAASQMNDRATKPIRILGEDLILYKSNAGVYGLVDNHCPHRRMGMVYGIPTDDGIRCVYHGWVFDETGRCLEQPYEETEAPDNHFKDKVRIRAYPLQVKSGLIFAYLGRSPLPCSPAGTCSPSTASSGTSGTPSFPATGCSARRTHWTRFIPSGCMASGATTWP